MDNEDPNDFRKGIANHDMEWINFIEDLDQSCIGKGILNNEEAWVNFIEDECLKFFGKGIINIDEESIGLIWTAEIVQLVCLLPIRC